MSIKIFIASTPGVHPDVFITDATAPFLQNLVPIDGALDVDIFDSIDLEIVDIDSGVDAATVVLQVAGITVWSGDAAQNGYTVTKSIIADGYRYEIEPISSWPSLITLTVQVDADDLIAPPNSLSTSYSFATGAEPEVTNRIPAPGAIDVIHDSPIIFSITDNTAVDLSSILVYIRGELVFEGAVPEFKTGWTSSVYTPDGIGGYNFLIYPDASKTWQSLEVISVRVIADD